MKRNILIMSGLSICVFLTTISVAEGTLTSVGTRLNGDTVHGRALYQGCQACRSIDDNDLGPRHRGVVGRCAGSVEDSLLRGPQKSGLTWNEATLDRWPTNPSALVPGTKMYFKIDDAQARADIIAYLKELD
jgi:cytochrome c